MRSISLILLVSIFLSPSCKVGNGQETSSFNFDQYFQNIEKANTCLGEGETFDQLAARLNAVLRAPLDSLESVTVLKNLFYDAVERKKSAKPRTNPRCSDIHVGVRDHSLRRIGDIGTEEAMDILIGIYEDEELVFINQNPRSLVSALARCGKPMLEKIEAVKDKRPVVSQQVIQTIESGRPIY